MTPRLPPLIALAAAAIAACSSSATAPDPSMPTPPPNPTTPLPESLAGMMVFIMPGGALTALDIATGTTTPLGVSGYFHHVSPDGRRLVFNDRNTVPGIVILDLQTKQQTAITMPGMNVAPRWSKDGTKLVFWSDRTGIRQLWVMDANGANARQLTNTTDGENLEADWSPDGRTIAFRRCFGNGPGACNIWLIDADGSNLRRLTTAERQDQNPRWSPDGSRIALVRSTGPAGSVNWDIWVMNADGSGMTRVTNHPHDEWAPFWSPDGDRLAFFRYDNALQLSDIFTVRPDGSDLRHVVTGPEQPVYGPPR